MKNSRGIKYKTILSVVIVVMICIGVLGAIVYQYLRKVLMEDALQEAAKKVSDVVSQLDSIERQMETITDYIITDSDVAEYIYINENETIKDRNNASYEMSQILTRFVVLNEYLSGITLVRSDGWVFSNNAELDNKYLQPYIQELLEREGVSEEHNRFFTNVHSIYSNTPAKSNKIISFVVRFTALEKRGEVDYLIMDMPFEKMQEIVDQGAVDFDNIEIYNYKNDLVYGDGEKADSRYHEFIVDDATDQFEQKDQIIIKNSAENGHWKAAVGVLEGKLFAKISVVLM